MNMDRPLLSFDELLFILGGLYGENEFDSRTAARDLQNILIPLRKDPRLVKRLQPKIVSNDLRRLYMMGFLRRRRVKRECRTKSGKKGYKGYKYMYRINRQGWDYIEYLLKGTLKKDSGFILTKEDVEAAMIAALKASALRSLEERNIHTMRVLMDLVNRQLNEKFKGNGYRRFPLKRILFEKEINWLAVISRLQMMGESEQKMDKF